MVLSQLFALTSCFGFALSTNCNKITVEETPPDVGALVNGDVFACPCNLQEISNGVLLNTLKNGVLERGEKYVARWTLSKGKNQASADNNKNNCLCGVIEDLDGPWFPSDGGLDSEDRKEGDEPYETWCVGLCGAQCGTDAIGLGEDSTRYASLAIHDVCQAYIGSTANILLGGLFNDCGDEGVAGLGASIQSLLMSPNLCGDGPVPNP